MNTKITLDQNAVKIRSHQIGHCLGAPVTKLGVVRMLKSPTFDAARKLK